MKKSDLLKLKLENKNNSVIRNLISTIIGELDRKSKDPSESEIISVIKKMREENNLVTQTDEENKFLESLIPSELSDEEMTEIVNNLEFSKIGDYMSYFKNNYAGRYDGKKLSVIVKSKLN